jgi:hypothetical protein
MPRRRKKDNAMPHGNIDPEMFAHIFSQFQQNNPNNNANPCNEIIQAIRDLVSTVFPTREQFDSKFQSNGQPPHNPSSAPGSSSTPSPPRPVEENKDPFDILEIDKATADVAAVKKAWKKQAMKWHPDKNRDNIEEAEARMKEINAAKNACLGILDGTMDDNGKTKPQNKWEVPSDEDDESDDSDYYNSDNDGTSGSASSGANKRQRQKRQRAKQSAFEKEQERLYKEHRRRHQKAKNKLQRERNAARARRKLYKKEMKMSEKTRSKKRRQRQQRGEQQSDPVWKVNLQKRQDEQELRDMMKRFDNEEAKETETETQTETETETETQTNTKKDGGMDETNETNVEEDNKKTPARSSFDDEKSKANEKEREKEREKECEKERVRLPFVKQLIMEHCDHDLACAIRADTENMLYQLLAFRFRRYLFDQTIDTDDNHILHYCAYFNSVAAFDVIMSLLGNNWQQAVFSENMRGETPFDVCQTSNCSDELYDRFATLKTTAKSEKKKKQVVTDLRPVALFLLPQLFIVGFQWLIFQFIPPPIQLIFNTWTFVACCLLPLLHASQRRKIMIVSIGNNDVNKENIASEAFENDIHWFLDYWTTYYACFLLKCIINAYNRCYNGEFLDDDVSFSQALFDVVLIIGTPICVCGHSKYGQSTLGNVFGMHVSLGPKVGLYKGFINGVSKMWSTNIVGIASFVIEVVSFPCSHFLREVVLPAMLSKKVPLLCLPAWILACLRRSLITTLFVAYHVATWWVWRLFSNGWSGD